MDTIEYNRNRTIPVTHDVDICVVGGGPGGIGAAVMSARTGLRTLLVERYSCLGGMATSGEVHPFMPNHIGGRPLDGPVYTDWIRAMDRYAEREDRLAISKEAAALAAEDLCLEAGAEVLYHHWLADVQMAADRVEAAVLLSKSGFTAVRARQFVDCTGDGDLAAMAGCAFEQGGPSGYCQPMTLCFKVGHVDRAAVPWDEINALYAEARTNGEIDNPRENVLHFTWLRDDVVHFNTTRVVHKNGTDGSELSEAEIEARRQVRQLLVFLRARVPGFEKADIYSIAHHIGVRESRRILGHAYLTRRDFDCCRKFPDAIARVNYPIDIHNPDGAGTEMAHVPEGDWYEIPFGCVVPRGVANLLVGGRPVSVDHAVHSSMRIMPAACSVGQGAGMGAVLAIKGGIPPCRVDGVAVREALVLAGAELGDGFSVT